MAIAASDEVIAASEQSRAGGIGTFISFDRTKLEEYKTKMMDIYSDASPGKNADFREALEGDYSGLKATVNKMTDQFHAFVQSKRPLSGSEKRIAETLSGTMFFAKDAKSRGLIDSIGSMEATIKRANFWTTKF